MGKTTFEQKFEQKFVQYLLLLGALTSFIVASILISLSAQITYKIYDLIGIARPSCNQGINCMLQVSIFLPFILGVILFGIGIHCLFEVMFGRNNSNEW